MPTFKVNADQYFRGHFDLARQGNDAPRGNRNVLLCERAMKGLIARYRLQGKSILSLGSGEGHEEYWFHRARCRLTLNDINIKFEAYLKTLAPVPATDPDVLVFSNEDAKDYLGRCQGGEFDALYVSSCHPDEVRREEIQADFIRQRDSKDVLLGITWPKGTLPYLDVIVNAFRAVKSQGLIILQHYRGGANVLLNRHYLEGVKSQFAANGVTLLEAYCFRRAPSELLIVAFKGDEASACRLAKELMAQPEISSFHGRSHPASNRKQVIKIYSANDPNIRPEAVFRRYAPRVLLARGRFIADWLLK